MRRFFRYLLPVLLAAWILTLSGCGENVETQTPAEGEYNVYYLNESGTKISSEIRDGEGRTGVDLADQLLRYMQETPDAVELGSVFPEDVKILRVELGNDGQIFVYFNAAYNGMDSVREILCRAAVVRTLTQMEEVEYVGFYINDQPLLDATHKTIILMSASSFVDISVENGELQSRNLTLYYANEAGDALLEVEKTVMTDGSISTEQLVVEQLIAGSETEDAYDTLPSSLTILSVSLKRGICYVNFDSEFEKNTLDVKEYIPIYSVVNSLTELPNINKVQISIDGVSNIKFRDTISLEQPLERHMDYVERISEETQEETETSEEMETEAQTE